MLSKPGISAVQQLVREGKELKERGQLDAAINKYEECLKINPNYVRALLLLAEAYELKECLEKAKICYEKIIAFKPNNVAANIKVAKICKETNQLKEAIASYKKAIHFKPNLSFRIYIDFAEILNETEQLEEAIATYKKAIEIEPYLPVWVYRKLADALQKQKRFEEAIAYYEKAVEVMPDNGAVFLNLGNAQFKKGRLNDALVNYQKAIQLKPDSMEAYRKLVTVFCDLELLDEAVIFGENLLHREGLDQISAEFHTQVGNAFFQKGKLEEAISCYLKAIDSQPNMLQPYARLRYIQMDMQQQPSLLDETIKCYTKAIETHPNLPPGAYVNLADLLTKENKIAPAIELYQTANAKQVAALYPEFAEKNWDLERPKGPNFIVIGGMKCGTTSIYNYLIEHPQVLPSVKKELHFFNKGFDRGIDWYLSHFPSLPKGQNFITGDASPGYLVDGVEERVFSLFPQVKLIAILRNPADRCISHYYHNLKLGKETRSFEEAICPQLDKFYGLSELPDNGQDSGDKLTVYLLYGLYVYFLQKWLNLFSKEQILILKSEDLFEDTQTAMHRVFQFLGLPDRHLKEYKKYNSGLYSSIDENIYQKLSSFFADSNVKLEELLAQKFNWK
jgi:tetratricopeptide (TPR) repeat protein